MIEVLESKAPPEVISIMFRFLKHPTAELLEPSLVKHADRTKRWEKLCEARRRGDLATHFGFPLSVFTDIKIAKGRRQGKEVREVLLG